MGKYGGGGGGARGNASGIKNDAQVRDARHNVEQEGGFDWTPVVLLGVMGATALFSFDRAYQKYEKHKEEDAEEEEDDKNKEKIRSRRDEDEERRRRRQRRREGEHSGRGRSEERRSRGRSLDEWREEEREVDENGFYVPRRRGRSRASYDRYNVRDLDRVYDRGYSVDYYDRHDRYGGGSRRSAPTW
ncbi:hypothetical protein CC79DRAFT_1322969 [Sarocladium strictum]